MQQLTDITERLASVIMMADPTDLPALADMHSQFQAIVRVAEEMPEAHAQARKSLQNSASRAEQLLEKIILREVDDGAAALADISGTIKQLQDLIQHAADPSSAAAPPADVPTNKTAAKAPAEAPAAAPAAHLAIEAEAVLNPDDFPLVGDFITESNGHIESAEAQLLKLEENPDDNEALSAIFRSFHTIKGVAGFLNLKQIGALAHAAENLLDLARNGKLQLVGATVDVVLDSIDLMKAMIASLGDAMKSGNPIPSQQRLPALIERLHAAASGTLESQPRPTAEVAGATEATTETKPAAATADTRASRNSNGGNAAAAEATVKVATERLDKLINMVGELVIAQAMVAQDASILASDDHRLGRNMGHLGKITRELQDLSMSMRMVPIQGVFQKMARLVRDLARKAQKDIEFVVVGGETELDRNVVEAISDPLVHMVRNAADHGIEPPDVRRQSGKRPAGRIELKAYHQAGNIVIEITDDGKGLNKDKILKKAIAAGIVKEGQELAEAEIFKLIFHAGLSTAEKITDVSGRGVGMDVVKKNVEALRGRIEIASVEGKGSTFTIRLPLTLAVIDGQVVKVGDQRYIIPITSIEQSIRPKSEQLSTIQSRGEMCMVRGDLLPLFRLYRLFGVKPVNEDPTQGLVVIVQDDQRRCCIQVDELLGQQQVVIKSLGEGIGQVSGISGGAILGDGNVSLILDVPGLIKLASGN